MFPGHQAAAPGSEARSEVAEQCSGKGRGEGQKRPDMTSKEATARSREGGRGSLLLRSPDPLLVLRKTLASEVRKFDTDERRVELPIHRDTLRDATPAGGLHKSPN